MRKKPFIMIVTAMIFLLAIGQSVWAFSDTANDPNAQKIDELKQMGILNGKNDGTFKPGDNLTNAAGAALLVKGLDLNIDHIRFIKEPKASDYYTNVKDDAWYSNAFIIAHLNGLDIPKDVDPSEAMSREQFAHSLFRAMMTKGDYAFIELYMMIEDEADVTPAYMNSIQKLLISKISQLDKDNKFLPKEAITRSEAAGWLHGAIQFVKHVEPIPPLDEETIPFPLYDMKYDVKEINEEVHEVTVTAQAPHPGYGMKINSITFEEGKAIIQIGVIMPDPTALYPQVITELKATTYIGSEYEPVLQEVSPIADGGGSDSSHASVDSDAAPAA
ncbi:S-layer homology domain-containing protein [Paenibacillus abyssi]|uniref:SLH domain-containing protein n=1 Tax=Paenibacillus abyssi TaxID=1340531 RepID=A0A917FWW3_9BACL|nr:S-layer homology domain-containing protein [Paenibacillus abyssi]GGG09729.1 hypothetical protein GCM10010916_28270 [Paenibacillus abyssi]